MGAKKAGSSLLCPVQRGVMLCSTGHTMPLSPSKGAAPVAVGAVPPAQPRKIAMLSMLFSGCRPCCLLPAHTDAEALLQDPDLQQNAKSLMACATKLGIAVPSETATAMLERWLYAEARHRLLKANGLHATLSKLRVPAPAGATRAAAVDRSSRQLQGSLWAHGCTHPVLLVLARQWWRDCVLVGAAPSA